jgi:hypothetical protein
MSSQILLRFPRAFEDENWERELIVGYRAQVDGFVTFLEKEGRDAAQKVSDVFRSRLVEVNVCVLPPRNDHSKI